MSKKKKKKSSFIDTKGVTYTHRTLSLRLGASSYLIILALCHGVTLNTLVVRGGVALIWPAPHWIFLSLDQKTAYLAQTTMPRSKSL